MLALIAAISFVQAPAPTRYDLGERLKLLDVAWIAIDEPAKRAQAVPFISKSVTAFFSRNNRTGCMALDEARCKLIGRELKPADALTLRLIPSIVEPGQKATLRVTWAYAVDPPRSVKIRIGREYKTIEPSSSLETAVDVPIVSGAANLRKIGAVVNVFLDDEPKNLTVSVVKNYSERIEALSRSTDPAVAEIGAYARRAIESQNEMESDPPIHELINMGESIQNKRKAIWQIDSWPRVKHSATILRAAFPASARVDPEKATPIDVVLAFHGAGGSENLFFEGYGNGAAVKEALKRGWAFVAPAVNSTCAKDAIDWLLKVRKIKIRRLFTIGHSMGTGTVLQTIKLDPKPTAGALFAPIMVPNDDWNETPLFMGVGKQELGPLASTASKVQAKLAVRRGSIAKQYENCEHLMIVAEAAKDVFKFFDSIPMSK